ncbi:hypothetical protein SISNIDRAFT_191139 [Sistotremastrum niveocremeum HHB9708]|uniref:SPX domain-containing protein n=2 Tax=Sistotremastraceae TaxID=3402574 RepID=A0A164Z6N8_9AGAM|nr:hypothetical protein SISNIDRAFT_191139 [Sistotremastrum niveocremeum HHB9708]KZT39628.1 hypothetical protein SISSUDRAFT_623170 [Sistotremastrum suecicum HHB10207 ss-3]
MKFGKQIQSQQIPGWSQYYLDYKFLKKIVSSLAATRPTLDEDTLPSAISPIDVLQAPPRPLSSRPQPPLWESSVTTEQPTLPLLSSTTSDEDRGPAFQAHKVAFFFKLARELEKINAFYLQKEAEVKLRLETLLSKRKAAALRIGPNDTEGRDNARDHVEWRAVEEGFRLLQRDLGKIEVCDQCTTPEISLLIGTFSAIC